MNNSKIVLSLIATFLLTVSPYSFANNDFSKTTNIASPNATKNFSPSVRVIINSLPKKKGQLFIALHTKESFLKDSPPPIKAVKITDFDPLPMTITFSDIPSGNYAISAFYDSNFNNKLDFFFVIPSEATAFSNNYRPMGPPKFDDASFTVSQNAVEQMISLK